MEGPASGVGIVWYARQDYAHILEIMEDSGDLQETYDRWLRDAERTERELAKQGLAVVRAWIAPDAFVAWCETQGLPRNAAARARWSSDFAHRVLARARCG